MRVSRSDWSFTLRRNVALASMVLAATLAFTVFAPPGTPGPIMRDFEAYFAAGVTVDAGADPYGRVIWSAERQIPGVPASRDEILPFVGPAASLPFWAMLGRLPYYTALALWTTVLVSAYAIVVVCALRVARPPRDAVVYGASGVMALAAAPMLGNFALGQAALVAAAGIAAALVAYRARWVPAALAATLISALQPNLAPTLLGRLRSRWDICISIIAGFAFAGLTLAGGGGPRGFVLYLHRLSAHGNAERFITIQHTPAAIAYSFGFAAAQATLIGGAVAFVAIAATVALIRSERLDPTTATLLCCATLPLAMPFFHEHDFVIEVVPVLVLAIRARGRARATAATATVLIMVDWFGLAQRHTAQAQILALGSVVAFAFAALSASDERRRTQFAGVIGLALIAAVATPLARAHPAPTWPDALPAHYAADPHAEISTIWAAEQHAAGLDRVDPVWGFLRGLPLGGCVLLGIALIADARGRKRAHMLLPPSIGDSTTSHVELSESSRW